MKIIAYKKYCATEHSGVILLTSLSGAFCTNLQMSCYECFSTLCLLQLNVWYCENTDQSFFPWVMCGMTIKSHLCCVTCKSFEKLLPNAVIYYKTLYTKLAISLKIRSCHFFQRQFWGIIGIWNIPFVLAGHYIWLHSLFTVTQKNVFYLNLLNWHFINKAPTPFPLGTTVLIKRWRQCRLKKARWIYIYPINILEFLEALVSRKMDFPTPVSF